MTGAVDVEPDGESLGGPCADCGRATRTIWGYVSNAAGPRATYFARWTDGHLERGVEMLVSLGGWGPDAIASERRSVGIQCKLHDGSPPS